MKDQELLSLCTRLQEQRLAMDVARTACRQATAAAQSDPTCPNMVAHDFSAWKAFMTSRGVTHLAHNWQEHLDRLGIMAESMRRLPASTPAGAAAKLRVVLAAFQDNAAIDPDVLMAIGDSIPTWLERIAGELEAMDRPA